MTIKSSCIIFSLFTGILGLVPTQGECDRHRLCIKLVKVINDDDANCKQKIDCISPGGADCMNDQGLSNAFGCTASDCVEINAVLKTQVEDETCFQHFPQIVGTPFERQPFKLRSDQSSAGDTWEKKWRC
jgi:hypothetical protein